MDTKSLKYFLAVAEYRNFTKAAEHLYITQSALSHHIAELETELETKLFLRTTRSVSLTQSGEIMYKAARDVITRLDHIISDIRNVDSGMTGELVIGHLVSPFSDFLPEVTRKFHTRYPDIEVRYIRKNAGPLCELFSRGELDIIFAMSFDIEEEKAVEWKSLYSDRMGIAVRQDHPFAKGKKIDLKALSAEKFVFLDEAESPNYYRLMLQACAARGFVPNIVVKTDRIDALLLDIKAGLAISIMPLSSCRYYVHDLHLAELEGDDIQFSGAAGWHSDSKNPVLPLFLSVLDEYMLDQTSQA